MLKLGLMADFKRQFLKLDGATVHMKEPSGMLEKSELNKREMREVVIQTEEPAFTREATEWMVKNTQQYLCKGIP